MFVIARHVNPLHMLRRAEPNQHATALVKTEYRLVVEHVGHRAVRRRLARYRAGVSVAEVAVDPQSAKQVIGGDLLVDRVVDLLAADRRIERFAILRLEPVITANGVFCSGFAARALPSARNW